MAILIAISDGLATALEACGWWSVGNRRGRNPLLTGARGCFTGSYRNAALPEVRMVYALVGG